MDNNEIPPTTFKKKLLIFDRIEVLLIFCFMVVNAIIFFILGARFEQNYRANQTGFSQKERDAIVLQSKEEENVEKIIEDQQESDEIKKVEMVEGKVNSQETFSHLEEELKKLSKDDKPVDTQMADKELEKVEAKSAVIQPKEQPVTDRSGFIGKYTIQLGSRSGLPDAKRFADGFRVRGYSPIINEVILEGRGTWYRVSLGAFDTVAEAKDYIKKEESLFQGQDYVITKIE